MGINKKCITSVTSGKETVMFRYRHVTPVVELQPHLENHTHHNVYTHLQGVSEKMGLF